MADGVAARASAAVGEPAVAASPRHDDGNQRFSGIEKQALRKLDMLHTARRLNDLLAPPANRLEALTGSRRGQHSIRINDQWRICFTWTEEGPADVEIVDYH
jgi:toxin HigB-1